MSDVQTAERLTAEVATAEPASVGALVPADPASPPVVPLNGHTATSQLALPQTGLSQLTSAIAAIMREIGIVEKDGQNAFHHYKYPKMETILQTITPLLGKHGVIVFQDEISSEMFDQGRAVKVNYEFTVCHSSGEVFPKILKKSGLSRCRDSKGNFDDKCFNKCATSARKYFFMELLQIPTGEADESDDADRGHNDGPQERSNGRERAEPQQQTKPASDPIFEMVKQTLKGRAWRSEDQFKVWMHENTSRIAGMTPERRETIHALCKEILAGLKAGLKAAKKESVDPNTGEVLSTETGEQPAKGTGEDSADSPVAPRQAAPAEATTTPAAASSSAPLPTQLPDPDEPFDAEQWLKDVAGACASAAVLEDMKAIKEGIIVPVKERVTAEHWEEGCRIYRNRFEDLHKEHRANLQIG